MRKYLFALLVLAAAGSTLLVAAFAAAGGGSHNIDAKDGLDAPTFRCEAGASGPGLAEAVGKTFQAVCKVRAAVEFVEPGKLPNDGKVIEDVRKVV